MRRCPASSQSGFSLIELMVVMTIIALLVTIALPRYQASIEHAKLEATQADLRVMRHCIDRYYEDKGKYPASLATLVEAHYLRSVPVDPLTSSAQTWIVIEQEDGADEGVVDVRSGARGSTPQGVPYGDL